VSRSQFVCWLFVQKASVLVLVSRAAYRRPDSCSTVVPLNAFLLELIKSGLGNGLDRQAEVPAVLFGAGRSGLGAYVSIHQGLHRGSLGEYLVEIDLFVSLADPVPKVALSICNIEENREGTVM